MSSILSLPSGKLSHLTLCSALCWFDSLALPPVSLSLLSRSPPLSPCVVVFLQNLPEVKQVQALRQVKERLQAENRALARVVVKLSQSACSQLPPSVDL